jgi:hypothetical protein
MANAGIVRIDIDAAPMAAELKPDFFVTGGSHRRGAGVNEARGAGAFVVVSTDLAALLIDTTPVCRTILVGLTGGGRTGGVVSAIRDGLAPAFAAGVFITLAGPVVAQATGIVRGITAAVLRAIADTTAVTLCAGATREQTRQLKGALQPTNLAVCAVGSAVTRGST